MFYDVFYLEDISTSMYNFISAVLTCFWDTKFLHEKLLGLPL